MLSGTFAIITTMFSITYLYLRYKRITKIIDGSLRDKRGIEVRFLATDNVS